MVINTYLIAPYFGEENLFSTVIVYIAKKLLVVTLFLIGAGLSISMIKKVGFKPLLLAVLLWIIIGVSSFFVVMNTITA
jgi:uncharacterized membrane protein YadS